MFSELLHRLYIGRCRIHVFQGLMSEKAKTTNVYKMSFLTSVEIDIFEAISRPVMNTKEATDTM